MSLNTFISGQLLIDVRASLAQLAAANPGVASLYDPATNWYYKGAIAAQIGSVLTAYCAVNALGPWAILSDQRYPAGLRKIFADLVLADPNDQSHFLIIEVCANGDVSDTLSTAAKLAGFLDFNTEVNAEGFLICAAPTAEAGAALVEAVNDAVQASYNCTVTALALVQASS